MLSDTFDSLGVECVLYICDDDNLCHMRILLFKVDLIYSNELTNNEDKITFNYTVECKSLVK